MNDDKLKKAYESALKYYDLPDFETFKSDMMDENKLRKFRDNLSKYYDIPDFEVFKSDMGVVKKKGTTELPSEPKKQPTTSVTPPKEIQKPSVSSTSKKPKITEGFTLDSPNIKVYSGLPGMEDVQYRYKPDENKWQKRDGSGWKYVESKYYDYLTGYFNVKTKKDITKELESNVKKAEAEKELSDKELASVLGWSEQEVKKAKVGSGTPDKDFKAAMAKPDIVDPSKSKAISTMAISAQKASSDLGPDADSKQIQERAKYYETIETQKYLKSIGYDVDVNGNESDEKTKNALNKQRIKQDVITKDAFKAADAYQSIDNDINQNLLSNNEEFVVTELRKKYSKDGFSFEETGAGNAMIVKYSPLAGVETREIEIPLNTSDINNVNTLKEFMKQSYMTASERKELNETDFEGAIKLMADNPYKYGTSLLSDDDFENHMSKTYDNLKQESKSLQEEYKNLQSRIDNFSKDPSDAKERAYINNKIYELSQKELQINNRYNDLSAIDKNINKIASINYDKSENIGNWVGVIGSQFIQGIANVEKAVLQTSMDVLPYAIGESIVDPLTRQQLKDKGYTDTQILDYASKDLKNNLYKDIKEGITNVSSLGTTTSQYINSEDRNDLLKAASFLAESIGTSLSAGGNPTLQKIAFFTQSYNAMEEQMMGPQFDGLNEWQKKLISVPYGFVIGALERYGIAALGQGGNPVINRFATAIVNRTLLSLPKNATVDTIKREINKNVGAMIAQGALRMVGGAIVEGGTEATQQLFEIGEKYAVNKIIGKDKETGLDYFKDTPDITTASGLKKAFKLAGTDFYYGALGGLLMAGGTNAYETIKQNSFNKRTDQEFEAFYDSMTDDKLRKLNILNTKLKLKNGEITKEEAKETIDAINSSAQKLKSLNANLSLRDKKDAFNLMLERERLEQEKAPLDVAMQAPYNERINNINNELKTISENAVKESTKPVQEVTAEGGGIQREGAQEGQPEVREGERPVGETAQPETDLGNRPVEGRGQEARVTREVVNRPATLSEFGGKQLDAPLKGDVYVDGQQVVFEDRETGRVYELGNVDEVMDTQVPGLSVEQERVSITPEGQVNIDGGNWNIQAELPTQGIEYNPAGEVTRVSLKDDAGNTKMFEGQDAVDIAYQIELQKYQTQEQQQFINDLLEQDEEFQTATENVKPAEVTAVVQEETAPDIVPTEPTAIEETVVEQPVIEEAAVAEEVERLGKLLEGTDEQIDEQVGGLKISKDNRRVAQSISNAAKAIAEILPDVKFVVHDTDASYRQATNQEGRSQSTAGQYNPKTRTIHINNTKANNRTAAHEVFHAVLLEGVANDAEAQRLTKTMIDAVMKSLVNVQGSGKVISYLNDFASNYEENVRNEEKLAELFGILADSYATLPMPTQGVIRRFLDRIAKLFGLKPLTDREVINFMNSISSDVAFGDVIQAKEIPGISRRKIKELTSRFQADFSDAVSKLTFVFDKNGDKFRKLEKDGFITRDKSLSDFNGKYIFLHQPDAAFSGMIFKDGEVLVEGKGGVFYPIKFHEDGYFWASTDRTAKKMADDLNKVMEQNGGTIYMALTSAPSDKLMSSTTMANAILDFFSSKAFDKNFKLTPSQLKSALRKAANDIKTVNNKKVGLDLKIPATATIEEMQSAIRTALGSENSSFADRKNFAMELTKIMAGEINKNEVAISQFGKLFSDGIQNKYFKGITKTGKLKISAANMTQALSEMFTEPMLKEGIDREKGGQVYAILELNGPVKAVKSEKHESYPMAIESANKEDKVTLHLLNDRQNWSDTFEDFETGDIVSKDRQLKVFPTSGVSVQGLKVNTSKVSAKETVVTQEQKSTRQQIDNSFEARNQKPKGIENIIFTARNNGFSDAAIREYLKQKNGLSDKEATDAINKYNIKEEDIWVPSKGNLAERMKNSLQSIRKKILSARSFLPKSAFYFKEQKQAAIASQLNMVDENVKDFNKLYSKYDGNKDQLIKNFDAYLRGDKNAVIPVAFMEVANSMRNQIDGLSQQLIDNGLVDAEMAETIRKNLGQYLTRSYEVYDNKNWKEKVEEEVKQKAINLLRAQYLPMAQELATAENMPVEEALNNLVNNKLNEMLDKEGATNFIKGSRLGAKDLSILRERQDIPYEIRALMGEYADPALNYARTILKLSSLAANHNFLTQVKEAGMGKYFFEKNDPRRGKDFNTQIATEGSETMNPLNGLYTTKEIAEAFQAQSEELGKLMQTFMKLQSGVRWAKTIGSIGTHFKNVIGNIGFVWINAHYSNMGKAFMTVKNDLAKSNNKQRRDLMNKYINLGIVKQSAGLGEIMDMFKDANFDVAMASRLSNKKLGLFGKAKRYLFSKPKKFLENMYQAEDDFFKIVAYENEFDRYSEALFGKTRDKLTQEETDEVNKVVTEIVKNTYPTYDRIPQLIKLIRRFPFVGNFVSFQAEAYRTAFNTVALAKEELSSSNPKIKLIGARRLTGATTYIAAKTAILQYFGMAVGTGLTGVIGYLWDDDDEEQKDKDIREFVAPWSKASDLFVIEAGKGKLRYIDFSATDPHGGIKKAINAFLLGESTTDSFIDGLIGVLQPFLGEEMTTETILSIKNNKDKYGKQIWNPEESDFEKMKAITAEVYKLIEPGTISSIRRGVTAESKTEELIANLTGFRTYDVDVNQSFGFRMKDYSDRIANAKRIFNSAYYKKDVDFNGKYEAYKESRKALDKIYKDIATLYNSAERLGVKKDELKISMKDFGGMNKDDISSIQSGVSPSSKEKVVKKELKIENLKNYQKALIMSDMKIEKVVDEIKFIRKYGGFENKKQEDAYFKFLGEGNELMYSDLMRIKSIQ